MDSDVEDDVEYSPSSRIAGKTRASLEESLSKKYYDQSGNVLDGYSILTARMFKKAADGNIRAFEIIDEIVNRDRIGGPQDYC